MHINLSTHTTCFPVKEKPHRETTDIRFLQDDDPVWGYETAIYLPEKITNRTATHRADLICSWAQANFLYITTASKTCESSSVSVYVNSFSNKILNKSKSLDLQISSNILYAIMDFQ